MSNDNITTKDKMLMLEFYGLEHDRYFKNQFCQIVYRQIDGYIDDEHPIFIDYFGDEFHITVEEAEYLTEAFKNDHSFDLRNYKLVMDNFMIKLN